MQRQAPTHLVKPGTKSVSLQNLSLSLMVGLIVAVLVMGASATSSYAQANVTGQWQTLPTTIPINPVHVALMYNGQVLIVSGSGNYPVNTNWAAAIWNPGTDTITTMPVDFDMFCNGMIVLPDGRPFVIGGTLQYDPFFGSPNSSLFNPVTGLFTDGQQMADGRWYPTATVLGNGQVMVFSGLNATGGTNNTVEFYTPGAGWSQPYAAPWTPPLYPRMHQLPNGNVFYSGSTTGSNLFNPSTHTWTLNVANTNYSGTRTYGSSVLMPLTPANNYKPRVMIFGGGNPATQTTEIIDLSAANPAWVYATSMSQARIEMNATLLPNGKILTTGGSINDEDATTASLNADLFDSVTGARTSGGANVYPRLYHSNALLLPDATVLLTGGNPSRGTYEPHMEIYSPAYLFNASGQLAARPVISSVSSTVLGYGSAFTLQSPDAATISSAVLIRAGSVTHSFDMDQRMVGLSFTPGSGVLNLISPPNGNIAPPGYYLLFILNASGVPSIAQFIQLMPNPGVPPSGNITSPSSNITIGVGQSVNFSGTGTASSGNIASYYWTFPGGSQSTSSAQNPGNITFANPGTYTISLTVTDSAGRTDPNPPTRAITVLPLFSVSASPSAQIVAAGSVASYTLTVTAAPDFNGVVALSSSGSPPGTTPSFSPATISTSGQSTFNVSTTTSAASGAYTLTILGSSSGINYSIPLALTITGGSSSSGIRFVQGAYNDPQASLASMTGTYPALQTNGDLNVVAIAWNDTTAQISSVTDTAGNTYTLAAGPTKFTGNVTEAIYFAKNITAQVENTNTVTVAFNVAASYPDIRIVEYAGADAANPLDVGGGSTGTSPNSTTSLTTTNANDIIVSANYIEHSTSGSGPGFTTRMITQPNADILEDELLTSTGTYSASAPLSQSGWWVMDAAAFRQASSSDTQPPTAPSNVGATAISSAQINLSWTASSDNVGVAGYKVERCSGSSCTNFVQIATPSGTTYNDTGLAPSTAYSYRVRATDAAGNLSSYSNVASANTLADTTPPTAPSSLSATAVSAAQINLSWTASTDNVGVTGYFVEQCQGSGCTNFVQIASLAGTVLTYSATGLTVSTSYSYRVRATDAAGNLSPYSNVASTTTSGDTTPPTAPSSLSATAVSTAQINLSWTASTDNVGVTGYKVERCSGSSCTNFVQIATPSGTSYSDTGLAPSTAYNYRVRATDAAGNLSSYSNVASANTLADTTPPTAPSGLNATAISTAQINLSWTASTDNVGVTGYFVEQCQGSGCTSFVQIASLAGTVLTYSATGLMASTSYSYRVRATDAAGNLSSYSNTSSAITLAVATNITFVQGASASPQSTTTTASVPFSAAQMAGDVNIVIIGWNDTSSAIQTVTDSSGNSYVLAVGPTKQGSNTTQSIYYAKNIASAPANANTVQVVFNSAAAYPDLRILEYAGANLVNPIDAGAGASSTNGADTVSVTTTSAGDLLVAGNYIQHVTSGPGPGFTSRMITADADIVEDELVTAAGSYSASAPVNGGWWVMQVVALKK